MAVFMDPAFWVAIALGLFLILLYRLKVQTAIGKALDARGLEIKAKLDAAEALHREAQALAESYRAKQKSAEAEAQAIIASAIQAAERLAAEGKAALEDSVKRRTELAMAKIEQAEAQALADVRSAVTDVAIAAATKLISESMSDDRASALVDAGIQAVATKLH
jgi:F-type H+-transporting ATPase subunit b